MKIVLIDLDGTLTDTAYVKYKPYKDGLQETDLNIIPLFPGAKEFIGKLQSHGYEPIIVSDSHTKYVEKIAKSVFNIDFISLCDKPNIKKVKEYLIKNRNNRAGYPDIEKDKENFFAIGDSWLDIEFGRALNIQTILTHFYVATEEEQRDGIGQDWKQLKSGATYYANKFKDIFEILNNPEQNLLAVEGIFQNINSVKAVKFKTINKSDRFTAIRALGRQQSGECDKYAVADKYFELQRIDRSKETLQKLAKATSNYLSYVQQVMPKVTWDYFTYVSDKTTTQPPNKLFELFELVETPIPKMKLISWKDKIDGSIKNQPVYKKRIEFVNKNTFISNTIDLKGKSIIIIDDQFTTGATAHSICEKFHERGVSNILFITLFFLISTVASERVCPHCGTRLQIKVNRNKGTRFLSCVAPIYKGTGCGKFIENID